MSQTRREIVFSARDNGVNNTMNQLRQSANQLGRELIREANDNSRTAKEAIAHYEQQIRLMEKRNKISQEGARLSLQQRYESAGGRNASESVRNQYQSAVRSLDSEKKEDQIQIELLRELIQTIRSTASQEERSDRINSINEITNERDGNEDLIALSDRMNQESGRSGSGGSSSEGSSESKSGRKVNGILNASRQAAGADDPVQAGTGAMTAMTSNPWVLAIAAIVGIGAMALQKRADREMAASQLSGMSGFSTSDIIDQGIGSTDRGQYGPIDLNVSREDFLSNTLPTMARAMGTLQGSYGRAMGGLELEKGFGLSTGTGAQLEKLARVMEKNTDSHSLATQIYSAYYGTGALGGDNQDLSRMQDMMAGFVSFRESQFMGSGSTNASGTLGLMKTLSKLGGNFGRDDYAFSTISSLNSGLQGGTAEAQAIKFGLLRQLNPEMDYFDLQTEMSKGIDSPGYLASVMKMVKSKGGTKSQQKIWLDALLGGSVRGVDIQSIINGDIDPSELNGKYQDTFNPDIKGRAIKASSKAKTDLDFGSEAMMDAMSALGEKVVLLLEKIATSVS